MSRHESQKRGLKSEAQKETRARDSYEPLPPSNPVRGAYGRHEQNGSTDQDLALNQVDRERQNARRKEKA